MTGWLLRKDIYMPPPDKDGFINKSLLSILGALSGIRRGGNPGAGIYYRINPSVKIFFTFLLISFLSLSRSFLFVLAADSFILLSLSLLELNDLRKTIVITFAAALFSGIILLPSALSGNWNNSVMLFLKITGAAALINALANSAKWSHITGSMKVFRVPDIFILVLDITIKYIVILGEFSMQMLYALRLRSVGRNFKKRQALSNLLGGLFMKSKEMAELTYSAMECRGFNGRYTLNFKNNFRLPDALFSLISCCLIAAFFLF